jgi:hypothetical protein
MMQFLAAPDPATEHKLALINFTEAVSDSVMVTLYKNGLNIFMK